MFKEELDPVIAKQLLGDEYNVLFNYTLYSDPDKFVIGITDSKGNFIDEVELKQDYIPMTDDELTADDEVLHPKAEAKHSRDKLMSWVITGISIAMIIIALVTAVVFMKLGGAF